MVLLSFTNNKLNICSDLNLFTHGYNAFMNLDLDDFISSLSNVAVDEDVEFVRFNRLWHIGKDGLTDWLKNVF